MLQINIGLITRNKQIFYACYELQINFPIVDGDIFFFTACSHQWIKLINFRTHETRGKVINFISWQSEVMCITHSFVVTSHFRIERTNKDVKGRKKVKIFMEQDGNKVRNKGKIKMKDRDRERSKWFYLEIQVTNGIPTS